MSRHANTCIIKSSYFYFPVHNITLLVTFAKHLCMTVLLLPPYKIPNSPLSPSFNFFLKYSVIPSFR